LKNDAVQWFAVAGVESRRGQKAKENTTATTQTRFVLRILSERDTDPSTNSRSSVWPVAIKPFFTYVIKKFRVLDGFDRIYSSIRGTQSSTRGPKEQNV
jgi:hypothetical protein